MALIFERIQTSGIAELSYLLGDDSKGVAAVIDPRADVDIYVELARKHSVSISHVFETHIHADLVSGARELAARTGTAGIYVSGESGARYGFKPKRIKHGDAFEFGCQVLTVRHTPGHTPEHVSYEAAEKDHLESPWGVFTGDSLFVNSAGRPDLLGRDADKLAAQLYDTLFQYFAELDDGVIIYPSHGHGSPCGADIGDRLESTIGYEKKFNPYYKKKDKKEFVEYALSTAPPEPTYYKRLKKENAAGPQVLGNLPRIAALPVKRFKELVESGNTVLVDTRSMLAFGGGHIENALNIGGTPELTIWAGWMLDPAIPILLVLNEDAEAEKVAQFFVRSGYTKFAGYLASGMKAWQNEGNKLIHTPQMTVDEIQTCDGLQVLDVRSPAEWEKGHIPCAKHIFLPEIPNRVKEMNKTRSVVTYCATGYRASLAGSLLQQQGFKDVRNMPGSFTAWKNAGLPIEKNGKRS